MVYVAIDDVSRVGPSTFNAIAVCDVLEVSYSLVNFHFGSRDELLAEAAALVYQYHITDLWKQVQAAKQTPDARLRAWIEATVFSFNRMGGWGSVINYPTASLQITELVQSRYGTLMKDLQELNLARLLALVTDVKKKKVSATEFELGNLPRALLEKDQKMVALAASIGFSTLGMAVWSSGRMQEATKDDEETLTLAKMAMTAHVKRIIEQI